MQAADEASVKPRVLIHVDRGMVEIHSTADIEVTVAYDDLEVKCDGADAFHLCSAHEFENLVQRTVSYRYDPLFCKAHARRK